MWFEKLFKWSKKDKSDESDLFKSLFPKVTRVQNNISGSMNPMPRPIPRPIPWLQLHGNVKMSPPNIDVVVKDVLDNMETINGVLNNIPVIKINLKTVVVKAKTRKLKSEYTLDADD